MVKSVITQVQLALGAGRSSDAQALAESILTVPDALSLLGRVFTAAQKSALLVDLIWRRRDLALGNLSAAADFMRVCQALPDGQAYLADLRAWLLDARTPPLRLTHLDLSYQFVGLSDRLRLDLLLAKYKDWRGGSAAEFEASLEAQANRFEIPETYANRLYSYRSNVSLTFHPWLKELRKEEALGHLLYDLPAAMDLQKTAREQDLSFLQRFLLSVRQREIVRVEEWQRFFRTLDTRTGLFLSIFHGNYSGVVGHLFSRFLPEHYCVRFAGGWHGGVEHGRRGAALRMMKTLLQQKVVLLAPDGGQRTTSSTIRVFDVSKPISPVGAAIAFDAGSDTGWCGVRREDGRLLPYLVPGPRPLAQETCEAFIGRWCTFYAAQIEAALSSSPDNLGHIHPEWVRALSQDEIGR